jgi:phosphopantothenoylcysteine decarboxylase/phosphopantothenoylcysteine decarboxylase/phosphopantothenate--cysteine ligase
MKKNTPRLAEPKTVVLGVTGSIAAYKAAEIVSLLRREGCEVFVVMTKCAAEFLTPLTLATLSRHPVLGDLSEEKEGGWKPGHIELADRADLLLIAPASANSIAHLACGFADDALGAVALATHAPVLVAPAMNGKMWEHPATQENVQRLRGRGVDFIGPAEGMLACGYEGEGRLAEPVDIRARAMQLLMSS